MNVLSMKALDNEIDVVIIFELFNEFTEIIFPIILDTDTLLAIIELIDVKDKVVNPATDK